MESVKCTRCGAELTAEKSIARGMGHHCATACYRWIDSDGKNGTGKFGEVKNRAAESVRGGSQWAEYDTPGGSYYRITSVAGNRIFFERVWGWGINNWGEVKK